MKTAALCLLIVLCLAARPGTCAPDLSASLAEPAMGLPVSLSLAQQKGDWTLYRYAVNHILCVATLGKAGYEETWLGTRGGVKRLGAQGRLLKLYTADDGLPDGAVLALAVEPKEAWGIVLEDQAPFAYCLCCLDRAKGRWEVLRQVARPESRCTDMPGAQCFIATGGAHSVSFVLGPVARSAAGIAAFVWNRRGHAWQEAHWEAKRQTGFDCLPYPQPTWAFACSDRKGDTLYLGTAFGLAQYGCSLKKWNWLLPDHSILGGTDAGGSALWLATVTKTPSILLPAAGLHLLRFNRSRKAVTADFKELRSEPAPSEERREFPGDPLDVVSAGHLLWLISRPIPQIFHSGDPLPSLAERFDPQTAKWDSTAINSESGASVLPLQVLKAAVTADNALPRTVLQRRLPGWNSPEVKLPMETVGPPELQPAPQIFDHEGTLWSVADKSVLTRQTVSGSIQRFPMTIKTMMLTPQIWDTVIAGDTLFALSASSLWAKPLPEGSWAAYPLPPKIDRPYDGALLSWKGQLWYFYGLAMYHWNTTSVRWELSPTAVSGELLGQDDTGFWFQSARGELLSHVTPDGKQANAARINLFDQDRNSQGFFGFAGGLAWLMVQEGSVQDGDTLLYGYDVVTQTWTARVRLTGHIPKISLQAAEGSVYATVVHRWDGTGEGLAGDTYRFDLKTRLWETVSLAVPPPLGVQPSGIMPGIVQFAFADRQSLWLLETTNLTAWRWDRAGRAWTNFPVSPPGSRLVEATEGEEAFTYWAGNLYVATRDGMRHFDLSKKTWSSLPMPLSAADNLILRPCSVDAHFVWALAYGPGYHTFAARFDQTTHLWKFWGAASGFPETREFTDIAGDGVSALATGYLFGIFRLNPQTDQWSDITPALTPMITGAQTEISLFARTLVSDPPDIWLHIFGLWNSSVQASATAFP